MNEETKNTGEDSGTGPCQGVAGPMLAEQIRAHLSHRISAAGVLLDIARTYEVIGEHRVANDTVAQRIAAIDAGTAQLLTELREQGIYIRNL